MKIESTDQDIRTLLSSGYYRIPRFQRPYSWSRENIQEFWDDIIKDKPVDYFIGSMVVFKDGNQRFGVVDGQQRLTTITLLLAVLRNRFSDLRFRIRGLDSGSGITIFTILTFAQAWLSLGPGFPFSMIFCPFERIKTRALLVVVALDLDRTPFQLRSFFPFALASVVFSVPRL